jgi:hypothetical protein
MAGVVIRYSLLRACRLGACCRASMFKLALNHMVTSMCKSGKTGISFTVDHVGANGSWAEWAHD